VTEWGRLDLAKQERDRAREIAAVLEEEIVILKDEIDYLRAEYDAVERLNLDLIDTIAELRRSPGRP
jgi:hypothetical protein